MAAGLVLVLVGLGALAVGILIGRYYQPDDRYLKREARRAASYIAAVNHLIAGDDEAAEAELRDVVSRENVEDIEPYFALGALFRSQGEHERAIRVHQAIALREGEHKRTRLRASRELGLDYRAAGMPRRATRALESCLESDPKDHRAMRVLVRLYDAQGRFGEAADMSRRLGKLLSDPAERRDYEEREVHLLCAAVAVALDHGDLDTAKRRLREARRAAGDDHDEPRLHVVAAELAATKGNPKGAIAELSRALALAPDLAGFLVPGLVNAARDRIEQKGGPDEELGEDATDEQRAEAAERAAMTRAIEVLEGIVTDAGDSPHLRLAIAELRAHLDPVTALSDYRTAAELFPDALPARVAAARLALAVASPGDDDAGAASGDALVDLRAELRALVGADGALAWATDRVWRCSRCGTRADDFFWRCGNARCRAWNSARLDVGRDALPPPPARRAPRLALARVSEDSLLGEAGERALPEAIVDSGMSELELRDAARKPTALGRLTNWLTGAFRGRSSDASGDSLGDSSGDALGDSSEPRAVLMSENRTGEQDTRTP